MTRLLRLFIFLLAAPFAQAASEPPAISDVWAKGTLPGATLTTVHFQLFSEEDLLIVGATSPWAERVDLREMQFQLDGGPLRPQVMTQLAVPARKRLQFTPVTAHLALAGLKQPVKAGDRIPLQLKFRRKDGSEFTQAIEALGRDLLGGRR